MKNDNSSNLERFGLSESSLRAILIKNLGADKVELLELTYKMDEAQRALLIRIAKDIIGEEDSTPASPPTTTPK